MITKRIRSGLLCLQKRSESKSSPWTVSFGPVAVLALVHACLREAAGPRSVRTFCNHLAEYGIDVDMGDVSSGDLAQQLRMLGLILDSPDAEGGMLLDSTVLKEIQAMTSRLVQTIVGQVRDHVVHAVSELSLRASELRTIFQGPPIEVLGDVFSSPRAGGRDESLAENGELVIVPVFLLVANAKDADTARKLGSSGKYTDSQIIDARNLPTCPRFLVLVKTGQLSSLSVRNACSTIGVSEHCNSGMHQPQNGYTIHLFNG